MKELSRVLVVEDDVDQARLVAEYLSLAGGFLVHSVENIQGLWTYIASNPVDLILLDYRLPDGSGLDILRELPKRGLKTPVVLLTGQGDERLAVQAIQLGAVDYLVKGTDYLPTLPALIQKAIRTSQLQQAVERSLDQVRYQALLLNNVRDAIVVWDTEGVIKYWNPAAEVLYQKLARDCVNRSAESCYLKYFSPTVVAPSRDATEGREIERQYYDGHRTVWVSSRVSTLRDYGAGARLIGYMDVTRDITSRKTAETALRAERNFITAVLDTVGALIVVLDPEGRIVRVNRACERITNYRADEVRGKIVWDVFAPPSDVDIQKELFQSILAGRGPGEYEAYWQTRSGRKILITWSNTTMEDARGRIQYVIATGIDITERRHAEEQIAAAQARLMQSSRLAAVGELAAGVAHHINNPLTAIIAEAQLLRQCIQPDQPERESIEAIESAGWRVQKIVQNLLEFSRPSARYISSLSVNDTIQRALDLIGEHIQSTGACLQIDLATDLPPLRGNPRQLSELWINLLLLARDATSDGLSHTIMISSAVDSEGWVQVSVRDDGIPIPSDELPLLFEPNFIQPVGGRGTGIEMSICQEIVRQHHGSIVVESDVENGTIFRVKLPVEVKND